MQTSSEKVYRVSFLGVFVYLLFAGVLLSGGVVAVKFLNVHLQAEKRCAELYPFFRTKVIDAKCHYKSEWGWILEGKEVLSIKRGKVHET